jgi:hypothetical protein
METTLGVAVSNLLMGTMAREPHGRSGNFKPANRITACAGECAASHRGSRSQPRTFPSGRLAEAPSFPGLVNQALSGTGCRHQRINAKNFCFPATSSSEGRPDGPIKPNPDQDAADLTNPELRRFNRFCSDCLHSPPDGTHDANP